MDEPRSLIDAFRQPTVARYPRYFWWFLGLGTVLAVVPHLWGWTGLYLHKEDGAIFLQSINDRGASGIMDIYSGYLHVLPKTIVWLGLHVVGLKWLSMWIMVVVALIKAAMSVAAFPVMRNWIGKDSWATLAALVFLYTPTGSQEALGNITNLRWFAGYFIMIVALSAPQSWRTSLTLACAAPFAVMTEPLALLATPFLLARLFLPAYRERGGVSRIPAVSALVALALHYGFFINGERGEMGPGILRQLTHPLDTFNQIAVRAFLAGESGITATKAAMLILGPLALVLAAIVLAAHLLLLSQPGIPRPTRIFAGVCFLWGAGMMFSTMTYLPPEFADLSVWHTVGATIRYSTNASLYIIPGVAALCAWTPGFRATAAASSPDRVAAPGQWRWIFATARLGIVAMLVVGFVGDWAGDKYNYQSLTWLDQYDQAVTACADRGNDDLVDVQYTPLLPDTNRWVGSLRCELFR